MTSQTITFTPLTEDHLPLLWQWFQKPHIKQWYARGEDYTLDMIREKYLPRILKPESIPNFIVSSNGNPMGYIQLYSLAHSLPDGVKDYTHPLFTDFTPDHMAGIDLFIAEEKDLRKGYGTLVLENFIDNYVKGKFDMLIVDPVKTNKHAIHFFERNGFKKIASHPSQSINELLILHIK
jgi:aminoglycoside 6'-N-acetyltransferase